MAETIMGKTTSKDIRLRNHKTEEGNSEKARKYCYHQEDESQSTEELLQP
ncbi:hypothetical protein ECDEC2B_1831 [Escherichia coli DEC2B]|nr:hypothetical protein [Escherichia coli]EHU41172.1 hypothetical protein ECDEC2B_1831 [Escherichia coli DEC2B]